MNKKKHLKKPANNFLGGDREAEMFIKGLKMFFCLICIFIVGWLMYDFYHYFYGPNSKHTLVLFPGDSEDSGINSFFKKNKIEE